MFDAPERIVLNENKSIQPRYSLSYRKGGLDQTSKKLSYAIISCLARERDLLIEIDSSLFSGSYPDGKEKVFEELTAKLRDLNIEYKYRKHLSPREKKVFGLSISRSQTDTQHELLIYLPNRSRVRDGFWELHPEQGATYRILREETNGLKLLDDIYTGRLLDKELRKYYEITIFDYYSFGQMGIDTDLSKGELEVCLKGLMKVD